MGWLRRARRQEDEKRHVTCVRLQEVGDRGERGRTCSSVVKPLRCGFWAAWVHILKLPSRTREHSAFTQTSLHPTGRAAKHR